MQTYEQAVEKIVNFWIEKSFKTALNQNNGDDSDNGAIGFMLMNMVASKAQDTVTEEKIEAFKVSLTKRLMLEEGSSPWHRTLDVDYHPCEHLFLSAQDAGIDPGCFPCKTWTGIDNENKAMAAYQYGATPKEL